MMKKAETNFYHLSSHYLNSCHVALIGTQTFNVSIFQTSIMWYEIPILAECR